MRTAATSLMVALCLNFVRPNSSQGQSISQGQGTILVNDLLPSCPSNHTTPLGQISTTDNLNWQVPAETHIQSGPFLSDLYNACTGLTPVNLSSVNLSQVPVVEIDPDGDLITAYLFSDNYLELYINGVLVGADPIAFTPFNSCIARFRVSRPYTIGVKLVDWEEHPGLGSEIQGPNLYHPGDGGFIARFSDGTISSSEWKAQTFYIAPLENPALVTETANGIRSSAGASLNPTCASQCYALHYPEPENWKLPGFSDSGWPNAFEYTAAQVTNQPAYTQFAQSAWPDAKFIWSSNLILDNVVLARYTVPVLTKAKIRQVLSAQSFIQISENEIRIREDLGTSEIWHVYNAQAQEICPPLKPGDCFSTRGLPAGLYRIAGETESGLIHQSFFLP